MANNIVSIFGITAKALAAIFRRPKQPGKRLEISILGRTIIAEVGDDMPCRLVDLQGQEILDGVYMALIRLWNRGTLPVLPIDIPKSAPLSLKLAGNGYILGAEGFTSVEGLNV